MVTVAMKLKDLEKKLDLGEKAMTNLDSVLKSRDVTLPTKSLWFFQKSLMNVRVGP